MQGLSRVRESNFSFLSLCATTTEVFCEKVPSVWQASADLIRCSFALPSHIIARSVCVCLCVCVCPRVFLPAHISHPPLGRRRRRVHLDWFFLSVVWSSLGGNPTCSNGLSSSSSPGRGVSIVVADQVNPRCFGRRRRRRRQPRSAIFHQTAAAASSNTHTASLSL